MCLSVFCSFIALIVTMRQGGMPRVKGRGSWQNQVSRKEEICYL